jgi:peptide deformylase
MEIIKEIQSTKLTKLYSKELHSIIVEEAIEFAHSVENCAGLASNQLGIDVRFFLMKLEDDVVVFCNPTIIEKVGKPTKLVEGCLSWPGKDIVAKRWNSIVLEYETIDGEKKTEEFNGFDAQVIQHEMDHINGIEEEIYPKGEGVFHISNDKVGRNDPCPCGSGKKFKKCCG